MVKTANFSEINKTGISQRVKYNTVIILAHLLNDDEWTKQAEKNLNTTKKEVAKRTDFDEYEKLKRTFLK